MDYSNLMETYAISATRPLPPPFTILPEADRFVALYNDFMSVNTSNDYDYIHAVRFRKTVTVFGEYLEKSTNIIELGGHSRIGVFTNQMLGAAYRSYEHELSEQFDLPDSSFDCVLCLEVIEHLKDTLTSETTIDRIATFNYSGVMNVLSESYRILEPGGLMLITTPNAVSVDVIVKVMRGEHGHLFDPHVRELAPMQVKAFAERVGFNLEEYGTFFAWTTAGEEERSRVLALISEMGFDASNRGDDAFFVLRKPT
jgi:SAM-dependent methyltransferase